MDPLKYNAISTLILSLILIHAPINVASGKARFECEDLEAGKCAFAVTSNGTRCILEKTVRRDGASDYKCQTSMVAAERRRQWIESNMCIKVCGLQRLSVGFSTDALHEHEFTMKLCLSDCRRRCPNINDLYTKLAEGEGIKLDDLCDSVKRRMDRLMIARQQKKQQEQDIRRNIEKKQQSQQSPPRATADPLPSRSISLAPAPAPITQPLMWGVAPPPSSSARDRGAQIPRAQPPSQVPVTNIAKSPALAPTSPSNDFDDWFSSPAPSSEYYPILPPVLPPTPPIALPLPRHHFPFPFPHFGNYPPALGT